MYVCGCASFVLCHTFVCASLCGSVIAG
uniref:Uncharacterized protein n=1 Tax=Anguilla anguilla TaxID=7936 RepID=A0A0E9TGH2_ANGAN